MEDHAAIKMMMKMMMTIICKQARVNAKQDTLEVLVQDVISIYIFFCK
jgi:hypothetical protein